MTRATHRRITPEQALAYRALRAERAAAHHAAELAEARVALAQRAQRDAVAAAHAAWVALASAVQGWGYDPSAHAFSLDAGEDYGVALDARTGRPLPAEDAPAAASPPKAPRRRARPAAVPAPTPAPEEPPH